MNNSHQKAMIMFSLETYRVISGGHNQQPDATNPPPTHTQTAKSTQLYLVQCIVYSMCSKALYYSDVKE